MLMLRVFQTTTSEQVQVRIPLLLFILIPLAEIMLLFEVSDRIGGLTTIIMVVLTAVIGINVLKKQGLSTLARATQRIQTGQLPGQEIVEGMMLAFSGALLLTPGFITDTIGFTFLVPALRVLIAKRIIKSGVPLVMRSTGTGASFSSSGFSSHGNTGRRNNSQDGGDTYEGEYVNEDNKRPGIDQDKGNKD